MDIYRTISQAIGNVGFYQDLNQFAASGNLPFLAAFILGLLGAASPCQLSSNTTAIALIGRDAPRPRAAYSAALAYLLGKALVYTLIGGVVLGIGFRVTSDSAPVIVGIRKTFGIALVVAGILLLGIVKLRISAGAGFLTWVRGHVANSTGKGAFLLGVAYALIFCPTLFVLFFILLLPLSVSSSFGLLYPSVFALGTAVPLLVVLSLLCAGVSKARLSPSSMRRFSSWTNKIAGVAFILFGTLEIAYYWLPS